MGAFEDKLSAARVWEIKTAHFLRSRGWYILPAYDFSGKGDAKAPKLLAPVFNKTIILPDLLCLKSDITRWVEIKYKTHSDLNYNRGYKVTGINNRLWDNYSEIEDKKLGEVYLIFLHDEENQIRCDKLANLKTYISHTYKGYKMGYSGMVFWQYEKIPLLGSLDLIRDQNVKF